MTKCPICYFELKDESLCPRCGTDLLQLFDPSNALDVKTVKKPLVNMRCERCGKGDLILVTDETDIPRYRCPKCKAYKGEFLHTGRETYYSTTELRVGQFIETKLKMAGHFLLPVEGHMEYLTRKISEATNINREQVEKAVQYLTSRNIIMIIPKGDHFEVEFK
ncbi:MAG: hypothetical protein ACE5QW_08965 [Thermoplasmata archaeon]